MKTKLSTMIVLLLAITSVSSCSKVSPWSTVGKQTVKASKYALKYLGKTKGALSTKEVTKLAKMINKVGDIKKVNKIAGKMKLSKIVREDLYMRILLKHKKMSLR